ncbi:prolyl oligopeptidase family serine peptidase [Bacteroidia bacterium]|nr:prolyl oligopeptidase family serine peptidase [Bacteroidia bacterium]
MTGQIQNISYKFKGSDKKLITADLSFAKYQKEVPIVVFAHGFKGFKDWGAWPLAGEIFAVKGLPFFKFNFSHNGTTPENLTEFTDLESFGNNNFKKEYDDLGFVLDFIENKAPKFDFDWNGRIYLIGHSRGGGIALLRASNDERITKCATWASVSDLERYIEIKDFAHWQKDGVWITKNGRTNQDMPVYFQFIQAYAENAKLLNMSSTLETLECPLLIVHGSKDTVVPISDAHTIYDDVIHSIMVEIEGGDHTFNTKHPLNERKIPKAFAETITETMEFFEM